MPGKEWNIPQQTKNKEILLVFLRAPELGQVKTRLAKDVGNENALALYKQFVRASLLSAESWAKDAQHREVWVAYYPGNKKTIVENWLGKEYLFLAQSGEDLGCRMANAMAAAFDKGAKSAVVIGTDIPQIEAGHISQAFSSLESEDVVLGPSPDGGYWLVGASNKRFNTNIFSDVDWGTPSVFQQTLDRCQQFDLTYVQLGSLLDVDTLSDLKVIDTQGKWLDKVLL